jgi:hypothetical protein
VAAANNASSPPFSNPFAAVQLNSGTTATPLFSFGAAQTTKRTSFSQPSSKSIGVNNTQVKTINTNFFQMIHDHVKNGQVMTDLTPIMNQYLLIASSLQTGTDDCEDATNGQNRGAFFLGGSANQGIDSEPASSAPSWMHAHSATTKPFSGSTLSSASPPSAVATFSFTGGGAMAAKSTPADSTIDNDDDPTFNPDDGKLAVGQEENDDEETLYEVHARLGKLCNEQWKLFGKGTLRLYRNKETSSKRMVLRSELGKVMLNVAVSKGMLFSKDSRTKKGKKVWHVTFK